ncbi:IGEB protein, partial [Alaudala cheleensis]|nr:IGEB protein [Alaudala cheleensis]
VEHITGIPHSPTGQSIMERAHQTLERVLDQQRGGAEVSPPVERLCKALFVLNFLNCSAQEQDPPPVIRHFSNSAQAKLEEKPPVLVKDPESLQLRGPFLMV